MNCWQTLTDMTELGDVNSELSKKYKDTILEVVANGVKSFCVFHGQNHDDRYTLKTLDKNLLVEIPFEHDKGISITIPKPKKGCYTDEYHKTFVVFSTLPHRQWKRGLCKGNSMVQTPVVNYPNNKFFDSILSVLQPTNDCILDEAIKLMDDNKYYGWAINRDFAITLNFHTKNDTFLMLFYNRYIIGKVLRNKKRILLENPIFLQEILDTKNTWCPDYEVVIHD